MVVKLIATKDIIVDPDHLQFRAEVDPIVIKEYAELIIDGTEFPPVAVFDTPDGLFLVDGFQRFEAYKVAGKRKIHCDVTEGTLRDAITYALGANIKNGSRLTNKDKRYAGFYMLRDPEFSKLSDTQIAKMIGATQPAVSSWRKDVIKEKLEAGEEINTVRTSMRKSGKVYEMETKNIQGKNKKPKVDELKNRDPKEDDKVTFIEEPLEEEPEIIDRFLDKADQDLDQYKNLKLGAKLSVGKHTVYYCKEIAKLKNELKEEYDLFLSTDNLPYLIKQQDYLLKISPNVCVLLKRGEDIPKLEEINLQSNAGTLLSIDNIPYYLAYYTEDHKRKIWDLSVTSFDLFYTEMINKLTKSNEHILLDNPMGPILSFYEASDRICTAIYSDPEIMSRDLMEFDVRFPDQPIEFI